MSPRSRNLALGAAALALFLASPIASGAAKKGGSGFKSGSYTGTTTQDDVAAGFNTIAFTIKKGKVTLTTEPVIRRELCTSPPVFTLDGATPSKPLSKRGAFTFTSTFLGTKIDKITGRFVEPDTIEGKIVYNFAGSDLCSAGATKTEFTATTGKQKKKKK